MDSWQAQYSFWSSFSIPAINELSSIEEREEDIPFPHLTYTPISAVFDVPFQANASLWYKSNSWEAISKKADEILAYIGTGRTMPIEGGILWVKPPSTMQFAQPTASGYDDRQVKRMYLTCEMEIIKTR